MKTVKSALLPGIFCGIACVCCGLPLVGRATVLDVYAELTGKTLLTPSALPRLPQSLASNLPPDKGEEIARLEHEMSAAGLAIVQDGPHFIRICPKGAGWADIARDVPLRGGELALSPDPQNVPAGALNFIQADANQVLTIYAEMRQRTILRPLTLPMPVVQLRNQGPLAKNELVYALETVLALNGLATVDDGPKFVQIVPRFQRAGVVARAPQPEPDAKLFDPRNVPAIGVSPSARPLTPSERDFERWRKTVYDFVHYQPPRPHSANDLLELYGSLASEKTEASKDHEKSPIWFQVSTPLTKAELIYAIETTFALNHFAVVRVDGDRVGLKRQ